MHQFWHKPSYEAEGYGVYEHADPIFSHGMGQLPPGVKVGDIIAEIDKYIIVSGGIQMVAPEARAPLMSVLDQFDFKPDGPVTGPTVTGTAALAMFGGQTGWATQRVADGFAVMVDRYSLKLGQPRLIMTRLAAVIANNASVGKSYLVIDAPPALLDAARKQAKPPVKPTACPPGTTGTPPFCIPTGLPSTCPPGTVGTPPYCLPPTPTPPKPEVAKAEMPGWVLPVLLVGAGAAAFMLYQRRRR